MTTEAMAGVPRPDRLTLGAFAAVALIGGGNAIAVKQSVGDLAPFWSAGARLLAAGLILVVLVVASRRAFPEGRSLLGALAYGGVGFAGAFGFLYPALREVPAGTATVFLAIVPLLTFALAVVERQERFRLQGLVGALIAVGGVVIVFADQLRANVPVLSLVFAIVATLFIAQSAILLKWIPRSDPFGTNAVAMLTGGAMLVAFSLVGGESLTLPAVPATWASMAYLVLAGSVVMFGLYLFAIRRWTASAVSYVTLLMPLVAVPLGAILLGERFTISFMAGAAVVLVGVYVGAFLTVRPRRSSATALPECLPINECPPPPAAPAAPLEGRQRPTESAS
jgi:drug/metabolite transporter (DMT)-like permease